jgi:hypothetical protein
VWSDGPAVDGAPTEIEPGDEVVAGMQQMQRQQIPRRMQRLRRPLIKPQRTLRRIKSCSQPPRLHGTTPPALGISMAQGKLRLCAQMEQR